MEGIANLVKCNITKVLRFWNLRVGYITGTDTNAHLSSSCTTRFPARSNPNPSASLRCRLWTTPSRAHSRGTSKNWGVCYQCIPPYSYPSPTNPNPSRIHRTPPPLLLSYRSAPGSKCALFCEWGLSSSWPVRRSSWRQWRRRRVRTTRWGRRGSYLGFCVCRCWADINITRTTGGSLPSFGDTTCIPPRQG